MFKSHFKLIIRKLRREKLYSFVNILGLTLGLTVFLIIALFVKEELSFDKFHKDYQDIYRVIQVNEKSGKKNGFVPPDYVNYIAEALPGLNSSTRVIKPEGQDLLEIKENAFYSDQVLFVDSLFLDVFSYQLLDGKASEVFGQPHQAVISKSMSEKLFGNESPIGKTIELNKNKTLVISGLAADPPGNSAIQFDLLVSSKDEMDNTFDQGYLSNLITYLKLNPSVDVKNAEKLITEQRLKPNYGPVFMDDKRFELLKLEDQHLKSDLSSYWLLSSDIQKVYLFSGLGLVVLLLAVINYTNLVTARALKKAKVIGLRKVIGAKRSQIMFYEFLESFLLVFVCIIISFALVERFLPVFNDFVEREIELNYSSIEFLVWVVLFGSVLGILSGLYPAFYMAKVKNLALLKGRNRANGTFISLKKVLVLVQFSVASILILITVIMHQQMSYLKNKPLGFKTDNLIHVQLYYDFEPNHFVFKDQVKSVAGIENVSLIGWKIGNPTSTTRYLEDFRGGEVEDPKSIRTVIVNYDNEFFDALSIEVLEASSLYRKNQLDSNHCVVTEAFVKEANWEGDAIGKKIYDFRGGEKEVVAIVKDIHSTSLRESVRATVFESNIYSSDDLIIKLSSLDDKKAIADIGQLYEAFYQRPFEFQYFDEQIDGFYRKEANQINLFNAFSIISILLALMGLLAMVFYSLQQRRKEVSIRKVLGATVHRLILMLNKEYAILLIIAFMIATPVAYYAMHNWLQEFTYRISLNPFLFIGSFIGFLILCWLVTLAQSLRVTQENPANVLRED